MLFLMITLMITVRDHSIEQSTVDVQGLGSPNTWGWHSC
jgi:hypothetical protein